MHPAPPLSLEPLLEIPSVPTEIALTLAIGGVLLAVLQHRGILTLRSGALAVAWAFYVAGLVRSVLLPMPILVGHVRADLPPLEVFVQPVPIVTSLADPVGMVLNIGLFVPFGMLLAVTLRRPTVARVMLIGLVTSLAVEAAQLLLDATISTGRVADVDDLIANTLGALCGVVGLRVAASVPLGARMLRPWLRAQ